MGGFGTWEDLGVKDLLRKARIAARLSQGKVARAEGVEVTPAYISKLETGDSVPSDELCIGLAKILGIDERKLRIKALIEREGPAIRTLIEQEGVDLFGALSPIEEQLIEGFRKLPLEWRKRVINFVTVP